MNLGKSLEVFGASQVADDSAKVVDELLEDLKKLEKNDATVKLIKQKLKVMKTAQQVRAHMCNDKTPALRCAALSPPSEIVMRKRLLGQMTLATRGSV